MNRLLAITTLYGEGLDLLEHWLWYYTSLGVDQCFVIAASFHDQNLLNGQSFTANILPHVIDIVRRYPARVFPVECDEYHTMYTEKLRNRVLQWCNLRPDDWIIYADLDEFYEYPVPLRELIRIMEEANDWAIHGYIIDRVAEDGNLKQIEPLPHNIGSQFPIGCKLTGKIFRANTRKIMLANGRVRVNAAHDNTYVGRWHRVPVGTLDQYIAHHFRWTKGLVKRLESRLNGKGVGDIYRSEIRRFFEYWKKYGKINLSDPTIEARWLGVLSVD